MPNTGFYETFISILLLIVIFVAYFLFSAKVTEGFGTLYDTQTRYTSAQNVYFNNEFNKALPYSPALEKDMGKFTDAVKGVDVLVNQVKNRDYTKLFKVDPLPGIKRKELVCSGVKEPILLPPQENEDNGCGWWYMDDDNKHSMGFLGARKGPHNPNIQNDMAGGKWIWNHKEAQQAEDAKICRKVKSCDLADLNSKKCGFCLATNIGVPINAYGLAKYPEDGRLSCADIIINPTKCPKPIVRREPIVSPDGTVTYPPPVVNICDPVNGQLTKACLIRLALGAGCTDDGVVLNVLRGDNDGYYNGNGTENNMKYRMARDIIKDEGKITTDKAYLGYGVCDRDSALGYYSSLVTSMVSGKTTRAREAASFFVKGTDFDPCKYDPTQTGPFELYCQQRVAREKGCQPDGSAYPNTNNKGKYDKMDWTKLNQYFVKIHSDMSQTASTKVQKEATKLCLGVDIAPVPADCGDTNGIEVLWYSWEYEWDFPDRSASAQYFYGRQVRRELPFFNTGGGEYNPYNQQSRMAMRIRGQINEADNRNAKLWVMTDDGVACKVNDKMLIRSFWDQGPTAYESPQFSIIGGKPLNIEFFWYQNGGGATFLPKITNADESYDQVSAKTLTLRVPDSYPLSRWDLYMGVSTDRNGVLSSTLSNMQSTQIDGKKCMMLGGAGAGIGIRNNVRGSAYKTFTFMTYYKSKWARLFALRAGSCAAVWNGVSIEGGISAEGKLWFGMKGDNTDFLLWVSSPAQTVTPGKWCHIAYSLDDDMKGVTIFLDGKKVVRKRVDGINGEQYKATRFTQVTIGHHNWACNGAAKPPPDPQAAKGGNSSGLKYLGCWGDDGGRPLPNRLPNVQKVEACGEQAKKAGYMRFGVQYYGECWAGNNADWNRAGKRDGCPPLGGGWNNQVYEIGPQPPPDCAPSADGSINLYLAWVHWFDYTLGESDLMMDKGLGYSHKNLYDEDPTSGWKNAFMKTK